MKKSSKEQKSICSKMKKKKTKYMLWSANHTLTHFVDSGGTQLSFY